MENETSVPAEAGGDSPALPEPAAGTRAAATAAVEAMFAGAAGEEARADAGPARDPRGRFAGAASAEPVPAAPAEPTPAEPAPAEPAPVPPAPAVELPASLDAAARAALAQTPAEVQRAVAEALKGHERLGHVARAVEARLGPVQRELAAVGGNALEFAANAFSHHKALVDAGTRTQAAVALIESYGVDRAALAQALGLAPAASPDAGEAWELPEVKGLKDHVARLEQQLAQVTGHLSGQQRAALAARDRELDAELAAFRAEKGEDGSPKRADFEALWPRMAALLKAGQAADLADAYDKASYLDPDTRARRDAAAKAQWLAEAEAGRRAEAEAAGKARKEAGAKALAAGRVAPAGGDGPGGSPARPSTRQAAEAAIEAQIARAGRRR